MIALVLGLLLADATLRGSVVDADSGKPIPCRVTIRGADGAFYFARSAAPDGSAVEYRKQAFNKTSVENHVTLSAHPFSVDLPPGSYTINVQHGKEYLGETRRVELGAAGAAVEFKLKRWINMAERGWYSGETHVHRMPDQLPNVMLAEDLNVALPLTSWVTEANTSPGSANKAGASVPNDARVTEVDPTHVYYSRNTEYEIFSVGKKRHTLGAIFILNHKTLFEEGVPPVRPMVKRAREEGALLELDKHNWPWSMMLAPVFKVDLYELANNHMWETEFAFRDFGSPAPDWMKIEKDAKGMTERGWIDYTFQNYYSLLNCGLKMRPTAGCASGVHPVPLGFGRVYVQVDGPFSYDKWMKGLNEGRSFVTTGPMLFTKLAEGKLAVTVESAFPVSLIELVRNGDVIRLPASPSRETPGKGFLTTASIELQLRDSFWVAARCVEDRPDGRFRWAHSAPTYVELGDKPIRPRREEVLFLVRRMEDELERNKGVLTPEAMAEYQEALEFYKGKMKEAR
ncbi:MAG: hypothetical protein HY293_06995 [Planctomycetes bacterium]|nr:hypothetical protein [Planctomycetota bacterium]